MSMEGAIYDRLANFAGLTALVSTRISQHKAAQNAALPYVVFARVSSNRQSAFNRDTGLVRARIQVDCWADEGPGETGSAVSVANQVRAALQRWSGTADSTTIQEVFLENEQHIYDDEAENYRVIMDFIIWYEE